MQRIVTCPRGSWRWQDAYRVAEYKIHQTRDGRQVWRLARYLTGKASLPQLRRWGYGDIPMGGAHNREVEGQENGKV